MSYKRKRDKTRERVLDGERKRQQENKRVREREIKSVRTRKREKVSKHAWSRKDHCATSDPGQRAIERGCVCI